MPTVFANQHFTRAIVAVLVDKLGGTAEITQEDLNKVAHRILLEDFDSTRSVQFSFEKEDPLQ